MSATPLNLHEMSVALETLREPAPTATPRFMAGIPPPGAPTYEEKRAAAIKVLVDMDVARFDELSMCYNARVHKYMFRDHAAAQRALAEAQTSESKPHLALLTGVRLRTIDLTQPCSLSSERATLLLMAAQFGHDEREVRRVGHVAMQAYLAYTAGHVVDIDSALPVCCTMLFVTRSDADYAYSRIRAAMAPRLKRDADLGITLRFVSDHDRGSVTHFFTHMWEIDALDEVIVRWTLALFARGIFGPASGSTLTNGDQWSDDDDDNGGMRNLDMSVLAHKRVRTDEEKE